MVGVRLAPKGGGHNKFLESIQVWLDISAPRYFWSEYDTYRVGMTKQSESTMHTILSRPLEQADFELGIEGDYLKYLNTNIKEVTDNPDLDRSDKMRILRETKNDLPEGFLQRRIISTNYMVLRNIYKQRRAHKLPEWQEFCAWLLTVVEVPEFISSK